MNSIQTKITQWVRQQLNIVRDDGACTKIKLVHQGQTAKNEIWEHHVDATSEPEDIAEEVFQQAESDANSIGGVNVYQLQAILGDKGKKGPVHRFRLKGQDPEDEFGDDIQTEPANSKGLVAQSQRHLEAVLRTTTAAQQQTMKSLMEENERLRKENNHLKDKFYEMQESYEELISLKHQRDMEEERQKNKERRMDEALQQFKQIAPSVVNRITGKRVLPEDQTPETQQLKNVLDDLDDNQLEQISKVLKPGQAVAFMEMVKAHLDNKEGEQNGEPKQLNKGA